MFSNYLQLALRNLLQNKVFSAINILGLSIGVAVCLLLLNFIQFQRSYDNFQANAERIYRVPMTVQENGSDAEGSWGWSDFYIYLLLRPGAAPGALYEVNDLIL